MYAQEAMLAAVRLRTKGHMVIDDAAIVSRAPGGKVRIQQTRDLNTSDGAMSGGWWGLLAGLFVGGPAMIVTGALGATIGGLWAKLHDVGISDDGDASAWASRWARTRRRCSSCSRAPTAGTPRRGPPVPGPDPPHDAVGC